MQSPMDQGGYGGGGGEFKEEEVQPWYVKYGIRALGTAAGGLAMFMGAFNLITSIFSPTCILFTIWLMLVGFLVICIEAPFCCQFVENVQVVARKIEEKPLWIKAAVYVFGPIPSILFCFGFATFLGGGCIIGVGVLNAMMALGKKASREEMARNAQAFSPSSSTYQPNVPTTTTSDKFYNPTTRDPVQAAAAQWASQSVPTTRPTFEPPPSYNSSVSNNQPPQKNWDLSFVNESQPVRPADPNNPFQ